MSFLVTRGLGAGNLVTAGLAVQLGSLTATGVAGALALSGTVVTSFIAAPVSDDPTNSYGRRFFGSLLGPKGKQYN